jgi:septal ring factor EnvC (AmiA/AmiB activator)
VQTGTNEADKKQASAAPVWQSFAELNNVSGEGSRANRANPEQFGDTKTQPEHPREMMSVLCNNTNKLQADIDSLKSSLQSLRLSFINNAASENQAFRRITACIQSSSKLRKIHSDQMRQLRADVNALRRAWCGTSS